MVSIIIPAYGHEDMTQECLYAVLENSQGQEYEIIVIDNGSQHPLTVPFSGFIETRVIRNEKNEGFPVAVNQGIRAAKGDTIILLNNDVIVSDGWMGTLVDWLDEFSIVAPVTNYCAGAQQVTLPVYEDMAGFQKQAAAHAQQAEGQAFVVNFVIGFCMAFRRALWEVIGPFDESLWPCSGEEIDFCFKAREDGHLVGVAYDCYVHHFGSATFTAMQDAGVLVYQDICKRNDAHIGKRWGHDFWERQIVPPEREGDEQKAACA